MLVTEAQREGRIVYAGGVFGQAVTGLLWLASAILATWGSKRSAILMLVLGGVLIFPLTTLMLRLLGRPQSLNPANPFKRLAIQVAFVLPLSMPLVAPVAAYHLAWFYPAMMILVGAHYLPFATLYGMRRFLVLSGLLVSGGVAIALLAPGNFSLGAWTTSAALLAFAALGVRAGHTTLQ